MQQYFEISNALIKSGGVIWDDHNGGFESKLLGMAALFTGKEVIPVGLHSTDFFSLNRVYLKDGKVHLSSESVAGVLFPVHHRDLWDCINDYNDKQVGNKFSCGTLENPMSLEPVPVTVITMTIGEFCEKTGQPAPALSSPVVVTEEMRARANELRADLNLGNSAFVNPVVDGFKGTVRTAGVKPDYGVLVAGNLKGIPFLIEHRHAEYLSLPFTFMDKVPEFLLDYSIEYHPHPVGGATIPVYALEIEGVDQLAEQFSILGVDNSDVWVNGGWVGVKHEGKRLKAFRDGKLDETNYQVEGRLKSLNVDFHPTDGIGDFPDKLKL